MKFNQKWVSLSALFNSSPLLPKSSHHFLAHVPRSAVEWQPFDKNALRQFCWCQVKAWLLQCWHKEVAEEFINFAQFTVRTKMGCKTLLRWNFLNMSFKNVHLLLKRGLKESLSACVRRRDKSQYVPTRRCKNKSVRMEHVTHHCVWMWRSEAMCGQSSLMTSWLKSSLTYTNSYVHADTQTCCGPTCNNLIPYRCKYPQSHKWASLLYLIIFYTYCTTPQIELSLWLLSLRVI